MEEPRVVLETHRVELTPDEIAEAAEQAAQKQGEVARLEVEFDALKKARKGAIDRLASEVCEHLRHVREKASELELRVIHDPDWEVGVVNTIAVDRGGLVISTRALSDQERQQHLFDLRGEETPADDGAIDGGQQDMEDRAPAGA